VTSIFNVNFGFLAFESQGSPSFWISSIIKKPYESTYRFSKMMKGLSILDKSVIFKLKLFSIFKFKSLFGAPTNPSSGSEIPP
jgi:hypothetical protein